jgi:pimeloyl-ACP methyl ester carboxylesterase
MAKYVEQAVNAIIRPPRKKYNPSTLPLFLTGPEDRTYVRHPVNISNERNQKIMGSLYVSVTHDLMNGGPCVFYMHGNASSQYEGQFLIPNLCARGIAVYCFDFAGCGASGGEFISLGHFERLDVEFLIRNLIESFGLGPFVLWGRSMGAATALLVRHPRVVGKIIDSGYTSIPDVVTSIARKIGLPAFLFPMALFVLKHTIAGKADFDLSTVSPLETAREPGEVPARFCHATDDEFIPIDQGQANYEAYSNPDKEFMRVEGGHNGRRPLEWIALGCTFAMERFGVDTTGYAPVRFDGMYDADAHFQSYNDLLRFMSDHGTEDPNVDSAILAHQEAAHNE